jgi:hypothetical protein
LCDDLDQLVERFGAVAESARKQASEREVLLNQLVTQATVAAPVIRRELLIGLEP